VASSTPEPGWRGLQICRGEKFPKPETARDEEREPPVTPANVRSQAASLPAFGFPSRILVALLVSAVLVIASFVWQGRYDFNIGDEGFLWYGVQRVQAGEVPIRDFMSYDPGRYYWSAALTAVLRDDGILALRGAVAAFQVLGLFVGLLLLLRGKSGSELALFAIAAVTLLTWMYPRHKLFDISLSIMLIGVLTLVVRRPSDRRVFLAGAAISLVAVFGRNHGVYGLAGILGTIGYLACRRRSLRILISDLVCCGCGLIVGYLPVLVMIAVVPGFATAFWLSIRAILDRGTNLPLPVPWPWLVPVAQLPPATAIADVLTGILFIAILAFGILGTLWVIREALRQRPVPPELVASSMLALPYAHYAFSRADVGHLAQSIFPFLVGVFVVLKHLPRKARWIIAFAMASASLAIMLPLHPGWICRMGQRCVAADVTGDELKVDLQTAAIVAMLKSTTGQYAPDGRSVVVAPLWPGAYALLKRKSPIWEIYALFPSGNEFQRQEIERIKAARPGLVLILDVALDGRDDLRFRNTHPLIEQFVRANFDAITIAGWPPEVYQFYRSRQLPIP
jgi:hypothetical protein